MTVVVEQLRVQKTSPVSAAALGDPVNGEQLSVHVGALRRANAKKMRFLLNQEKS